MNAIPGDYPATLFVEPISDGLAEYGMRRPVTRNQLKWMPYGPGSTFSHIMDLIEKHVGHVNTYCLFNPAEAPPAGRLWTITDQTTGRVELAEISPTFWAQVNSAGGPVAAQVPVGIPPSRIRPMRTWASYLLTCVPFSHLRVIRALAIDSTPTDTDIPGIDFQTRSLSLVVVGNLSGTENEASVPGVASPGTERLRLRCIPAIFVGLAAKDLQGTATTLPGIGLLPRRIQLGVQDGPFPLAQAVGTAVLAEAFGLLDPEWVKFFFGVIADRIPVVGSMSPLMPSFQAAKDFVPAPDAILATVVPRMNVELPTELEAGTISELTYPQMLAVGLYMINRQVPAPGFRCLHSASRSDAVGQSLEQVGILYGGMTLARGQLWDKYWLARTLQANSEIVPKSIEQFSTSGKFTLFPHPIGSTVFEWQIRICSQITGFRFGATAYCDTQAAGVRADVAARIDGSFTSYVKGIGQNSELRVFFRTRDGEVENSRELPIPPQVSPQGVACSCSAAWSRIHILSSDGTLHSTRLPAIGGSTDVAWQARTSASGSSWSDVFSVAGRVDAIGLSRSASNLPPELGPEADIDSAEVIVFPGSQLTRAPAWQGRVAISLPKATKAWNVGHIGEFLFVGALHRVALAVDALTLSVASFRPDGLIAIQWKALGDFKGTLVNGSAFRLALGRYIDDGIIGAAKALFGVKSSRVFAIGFNVVPAESGAMSLPNPKSFVVLGQVDSGGAILWHDVFAGSPPPVDGVTAKYVSSGGSVEILHDIAIGSHSVYVAKQVLVGPKGQIVVDEYMMPPALRDGLDLSPWIRLYDDRERWHSFMSEEALAFLRGRSWPSIPGLSKSDGLWVRHELPPGLPKHLGGDARLTIVPASGAPGADSTPASALIRLQYESSIQAESNSVALVTVDAVEGGWRDLAPAH
jgi:hypothetical protein